MTPIGALSDPAETLCEHRYPSQLDYMRMLSKFPSYAERGIKYHQDLPYVGEPSHDENGIRTTANWVLVNSLLASDPEYDLWESNDVAYDRAHLLKRARQGLRYLTKTHLTGDLSCPDGVQWGRAWQSSWWTAKMALGSSLIWFSLDEEERLEIERVVVDEAECQLNRRANSGLFEDTKAEENAWDTEILAAALLLFPNHDRASRWREKLIEFAANTLSAPQDRYSTAILDGCRVRDLVYTTNIHSDFTIENHGAYHFCYVASPLQSITFSYLALTLAGQEVPDALFHNVAEFWARAKTTFLDNRFAYIGGKEWARYTYGLYFIVPAVAMFQRQFADIDSRNIEAARVERIEREQLSNNDGSFFGTRVSRDRFFGQEAKYETDCYASLGLAYLLRRTCKVPTVSTPRSRFVRKRSTRHVSTECRIAWVRTPEFFASFSWRSLDTPEPMALFVPTGMDDYAEWQPGNLLGRVDFGPYRRALLNQSLAPDGEGFVADGTIMYWGERGELLHHRVRFAVDPDSAQAIVDSEFIAKSDLLIRHARGLTLHVANDPFHGGLRQIESDLGTLDVNSGPLRRGTQLPRHLRAANKVLSHLGLDGHRRPCGQQWIRLGGRLKIADLTYGSGFTLHQSPRHHSNHSIHYDVVTTGSRHWFRAKAGTTVLRTRAVITASPSMTRPPSPEGVEPATISMSRKTTSLKDEI